MPSIHRRLHHSVLKALLRVSPVASRDPGVPLVLAKVDVFEPFAVLSCIQGQGRKPQCIWHCVTKLHSVSTQDIKYLRNPIDQKSHIFCRRCYICRRTTFILAWWYLWVFRVIIPARWKTILATLINNITTAGVVMECSTALFEANS